MGMTKQERIIAAYNCVNDKLPDSRCEKCPYGYEYIDQKGDNYFVSCNTDMMIDDAFAMLRAKEPRMMTLDEVKAAKGSGTPVYVEDVKEHYSEMAFVSVVDGFDEWVHISFHGEKSIFGKRCREYGTKWRCWTSRPTNKQRKEVVWDG